MSSNKRIIVLVMAVLFMIGAASTALAGTWSTGKGEHQNNWWYDNGNGTYANNGWQWIDGDNDGIAECYYFDSDGWLVTNTTTSDGFQVDENGSWIVDGSIQTQKTDIGNAESIETVKLLEGNYRYYKTDIFDENTKTVISDGKVYDGTVESLNNILETDRYPFQLWADPFWEISIRDVTDNSFLFCETEMEHGTGYTIDGDKWRPTFSKSYADWSHQEEGLTEILLENVDSDFYCIIENNSTIVLYDTYNVINTETGEATGQVYTEIRTYKKIS